MKVLVAEPLADEGIEILRVVAEVDVRLDLDREALLAAIGDYDAVIVRSATKIDKEVIERGTSLKVIGRAGIGVDNIDVDVATRQGVVVVNDPQSITLSTAEHTMALLLAMARHIPAADASTRSGKWERGKFTGVELHGKTLGILGLGHIGILVAQRASSFGMKIIARDPYVSNARASQLGIEPVGSVDDLCRRADFITIHVPGNAETKGMISGAQFALMKNGVRIINAARGGIVDEAALLKALSEGKVAAAAVDVFETEPPGRHPFFEHPSIIVTPHLGGSTEEAQAKAGAAIAEQVLLALQGEFAPYAVNIEGGAQFVEMLRPFIPLAEKLGKILTGVADAPFSAIHFEFQGTVAEQDTRILTLAGLKGLFASVVQEPVTYVNASLVAAERGIEVKETKSAMSHDYVNLISIRGETDEGSITVAGSLVGKKESERIVGVYDYTIDMPPERLMCFLRYQDRPGVIGKVGSVLGEGGINIASMQVGRENIGGEALMGLTVDDTIPPGVLEQIVEAIGARDAKFIDLA